MQSHQENSYRNDNLSPDQRPSNNESISSYIELQNPLLREKYERYEHKMGKVCENFNSLGNGKAEVPVGQIQEFLPQLFVCIKLQLKYKNPDDDQADELNDLGCYVIEILSTEVELQRDYSDQMNHVNSILEINVNVLTIFGLIDKFLKVWSDELELVDLEYPESFENKENPENSSIEQVVEPVSEVVKSPPKQVF